MPPTPFGPAWEDLDLLAVRTFFADAGDETLAWEAKGTTLHREQVRNAASAFGNGLVAGHLVLGASRQDRHSPWVLDGLPFTSEPAAWITDVLRNGGVDPVPDFDVRPFPLDDLRHLVLVRFEPVAVPPVITSRGQVYERVSGTSQLVTQSAALRRLIDRGTRARDIAYQQSNVALNDFGSPLERDYQIVIAAASASLQGDYSATVFTDSFEEQARWILTRRLVVPMQAGGRPTGVDMEVSQSSLLIWNGRRDTAGYAIKADRHGSVAIGSSGIVPAGLDAVAGDPGALNFLWRAISDLASAIAPHAPKHVTMNLSHPGQGGKQISRWWDVDGPTPSDIVSVQREARRIQGVPAFEE